MFDIPVRKNHVKKKVEAEGAKKQKSRHQAPNLTINNAIVFLNFSLKSDWIKQGLPDNFSRQVWDWNKAERVTQAQVELQASSETKKNMDSYESRL